jgi:hypothetical protein
MYNVAHIRNRDQNRGAYVADKNPSYRGEIPLPYRTLLLGEERPCHPMTETYTHRLLRLAEEHDVRVYAVILPFSPRLQEARQAKGLDAAYDRFIGTFLAHPNFVVLDARYSGFETRVFRAASHLDYEGANALSAEIADRLRRDRRVALAKGGPETRWVNLPPYRRTPIDVPIETFAETEKALFTPKTIRR